MCKIAKPVAAQTADSILIRKFRTGSNAGSSSGASSSSGNPSTVPSKKMAGKRGLKKPPNPVSYGPPTSRDVDQFFRRRPPKVGFSCV